MKQFKLTLVLTILMSMVGLQAFADWDSSTKIHEGDLYYYLDKDNLQAQVTSMPSGDKYTGDIMIPSTFTYNETNYSVTSIGDDAFSRCLGLTSVIIPNSVTSIGNSAFGDCFGLTSVTIPNSVTSIGDHAFSGCSGLTSVTIPNSVTSIGVGAFYNTAWYNNQLDGLVYAGKVAYKYKGTMPANTVISILEGTLGIAGSAFRGCSGLTSVTIPNSVTSIGNSAFEDCSGLTSVTIPNSVTSIGNSAFRDCSGLTSVTIGNSVTSIGDYAFYGCSGLTSVTIPNSVTSIGNSAFRGCSGLTSVTIGNSVTSIGDYAFSDCGLTSVTIPNSVTSIGTSAFYGCSGLTSIIVASGNTKYDSRNNCNAIIETASNTLLYGCKNTTIPNSVTSIGKSAFSWCSGLTSVTIPNSVTSIGNQAFYRCSGLTSVTIGNSVTSIGDRAFQYCYDLTSVAIPNSVTSIGDYAFRDCSGLTSVTIPNSVTSIGQGSFGGCSGLTSVTIPNSVTSIDYAAFSGCSGLTSVTIPNSVTSIGLGAFGGCSGLTSVTIPNSVTSIGDYAFEGCSGLTSVTVDINTPLTITANTFTNRANATLIVPAGSKSAYEAADYWKEFEEIVEGDPASVTIAMNAGAGNPRSMVGYSSEYGLDFTGITGIKAYIVCGFNFKKEAMLVHVNVVPPYTGFVIKTTNSSYDGEEFVVPTSTDDYYYANLLLPVVESQTVQPTETIDDVEYTNLMVGILNNEQPGFVRLTDPVVRQNKSYLRVPTSLYNSSASARQLGGISMVFEDDEATGISNLNDNVNDNIDANAPRYNIAGQRVDAGYKGVVIQNGKKILIK